MVSVVSIFKQLLGTFVALIGRWFAGCDMHCCHCIHRDRRRPERLSSGGYIDGGGVLVVLSYTRLDCCIDPTLLGNSTNITALATLYLHQSRCTCGSAMAALFSSGNIDSTMFTWYAVAAI